MTAKKKSTKTTKKKSKSTKAEDDSVSLDEQLKHEKDKNLRLFAEFDNFRKRTAKERIELFSTASQDIMTSLLPILDNFERAFKLNEPEEKGLSDETKTLGAGGGIAALLLLLLL